MNALAVDVLQSKISVLEEIGQSGLDPGRLCHLLETWIEETLGAKARVLLVRESPEWAHWTLPELGKDYWRFSLDHAGQRLGVLELTMPESSSAVTSPMIVVRLADQFARLLDASHRLETASRQAIQDELTGLGNRRLLNETLGELCRDAHRNRFPFSIIMFDVDHFKRFNELWGHDAGDRTLKMVAQLMSRVFRRDDVICRFGGEEFVVVLADRAQDQSAAPVEAIQFAERLLREADAMYLSDERGRLLSNITLSGGVANFPWHGQTPEELLRAADHALRQAKHQGRNRICLAGGHPDQSLAVPVI